MSVVFVLGNATVDLSLSLQHLVRPGETAVASAAARAPGGKGLNQAVVAARTGASVRFMAPVGQDSEADFIASVLAGEDLAELVLLPKPCPTDRSIVMVSADGENSIVSLCFCADALTEVEAAGFAARCGPDDWLLLQGNLTQKATLAAMRAARGRVMLNPAPLRWPVAPLLPRCVIVVVNRGEAADITGCADPAAAAIRLLALGCAIAIVTLGEDGCLWADSRRFDRLPAPTIRPIDTSGAGDSFCGVLMAYMAGGAAIRDAIAAAQAGAALSVTRPGAFAAFPSTLELRAMPPGVPGLP